MSESVDSVNIINDRISKDLDDFENKYNNKSLNKMEQIMMTDGKYKLFILKIIASNHGDTGM